MEIWKEKQHQKLVVIFFRCKTFAPTPVTVKHFFRVYITYLNTRKVGRIRDSYANPRLRLGYVQLSRILPASECLDESMRTPKKCPIAVHLSTNKTARSISVYFIDYHNCLSNCVTTLSSAKVWNTFSYFDRKACCKQEEASSNDNMFQSNFSEWSYFKERQLVGQFKWLYSLMWF